MIEQDIPNINFTFLSSIDWRDPWIIGLFIFHITITLTALLTRNHVNFQVFLFLILLSLAYFSANINELAARNWELFSRQQYFDSDGFFISVVFSMPILLNCMLILGAWLWESMQSVKYLKAAQLREKRKKEKMQQQRLLKTD